MLSEGQGGETTRVTTQKRINSNDQRRWAEIKQTKHNLKPTGWRAGQSEGDRLTDTSLHIMSQSDQVIWILADDPRLSPQGLQGGGGSTQLCWCETGKTRSYLCFSDTRIISLLHVTTYLISLSGFPSFVFKAPAHPHSCFHLFWWLDLCSG